MPQYMGGWYTKVDSTFRTNDLIGGNGGKSFVVDLLDQGASVRELKAWLQDETLCGIQITMSNDRREFFGFRSETTEKFEFDEFEKITKLVIISDKKFDPNDTQKSFLRGITIETNKGREWKFLPEKLNKEILEWDYPVGSGICCGIFGFADHNYIYQIGFVMLKAVREALLKNIKYSKLDESTKTFPDIISSCTYINSSVSEQTHKMKATRTLSKSQTWGVTTSLARTLGFKVEGGYPRTLKIGANSSSTKGTTAKHDSISTEEESKNFEWSVTCSPKSKLEASAILFTYEIETDYEGTMELRMESGKVFSYKEKGTFKGINRAHCELHCEEASLETKKGTTTGKK